MSFSTATETPDHVMSKNIACLATNVYKESRGEPISGQYAVAHVTMNRAKSPYKVCSTVYAPYQFSWTLKNSKLNYDDKSLRIANAVINNKADNFKITATHFHAVSVKPDWSVKFKRLKRIGNHVFYKEV